MITIQEIQLESDSKKGNMVVLKESPEAKRLFMMFVGDAEFAAIAKEKGLFQPKRPLTYELYLGIMEKLEVDFVGVEIAKVQEDTYYAEVVFRVGGVEHRMDSRPSDAVALALNRKIPIKVSAPLFRRQLTQEQIKEFEGLVKTVKF
jgi:bifunctional DNase/RNase